MYQFKSNKIDFDVSLVRPFAFQRCIIESSFSLISIPLSSFLLIVSAVSYRRRTFPRNDRVECKFGSFSSQWLAHKQAPWRQLILAKSPPWLREIFVHPLSIENATRKIRNTVYSHLCMFDWNLEYREAIIFKEVFRNDGDGARGCWFI